MTDLNITEMLKEAQKGIDEDRERRLPKWMKRPKKEHVLDESARRLRRERNRERAELRPLRRKRRRHGRPMGR